MGKKKKSRKQKKKKTAAKQNTSSNNASQKKEPTVAKLEKDIKVDGTQETKQQSDKVLPQKASVPRRKPEAPVASETVILNPPTKNTSYPGYILPGLEEMQPEVAADTAKIGTGDASLREQYDIIKNLIEQSKEAHEQASGSSENPNYPLVAVPLDWLKTWETRVSSDVTQSVEKLGKVPPGDSTGKVEVDWIPYSAWRAFCTWYGSESKHPVVRKANDFSASPYNGQFSAGQLADLEERVRKKLQRIGAFQPHWKSHWHPHPEGVAISEDNKFYLQCFVCEESDNLFRCGNCELVLYCSRGCQASHREEHESDCKAKRPAKHSPRRGQTGLNNLGNTCFMSSAVQCLSATWPLTRYFLRREFLKDINTKNPMGTGGETARVWYVLMQQIWLGVEPAVAPRHLKAVASQLPGSANRFEGHNQHDAQELLAMLLDALHEDLNLVTKKPYFPLPDQDLRSEPLQAAQSWVNNWQRDRSVVGALFQGQLESALECPACSNRSTTFEPFMALPLALPDLNQRVFRVRVLASHSSPGGTGRRQRVAVSLPANSTGSDLRDEVAQLVGVEPQELWMVVAAQCRLLRIVSLEERGIMLDEEEEEELVAYHVPDIDPFRSLFVMFQVGPSTVGKEALLAGFPALIPLTGKESVSQVRGRILEYVKAVAVSRGQQEPDCVFNEESVCVRVTNEKAEPLKGSDSNPLLLGDSEETIMNVLKYHPAFVSLEWTLGGPLGHLQHPDDVSEVRPNWPIYRSSLESDHCSVEKWAEGPATGESIPLQRCIDQFVRRERLGEGDTWKCGKCQTNQRAWKSMRLLRPPQVLVINLKRFQQPNGETFASYVQDKLSTLVDFPLKGLDLSPYCTGTAHSSRKRVKEQSADLLYDLYGVINHYGSLGYGHYTATIALEMTSDEPASRWVEVDDQSVKDCHEDYVCTPAAYVLFYRLRQSEDSLS